jgi:hypothetical protein
MNKKKKNRKRTDFRQMSALFTVAYLHKIPRKKVRQNKKKPEEKSPPAKSMM